MEAVEVSEMLTQNQNDDLGIHRFILMNDDITEISFLITSVLSTIRQISEAIWPLPCD